MSTKTVIKHHSELTKAELYSILQLRNQVFIVELQCPVADVEGDLVADTTHLMRFRDNTLVSYLRLHPTGESVKIRRVVVAKNNRGKGEARELMKESIAWARSQRMSTINLAARIHLKGFYESLGFVQVSEKYFHEQVQVWHVDMKLELN